MESGLFEKKKSTKKVVLEVEPKAPLFFLLRKIPYWGARSICVTSPLK